MSNTKSKVAGAFFTGKCKWAKLKKPDDKYNKYTIQLQLDDYAKATLAAHKSMVEIKTAEDGTHYCSFGRPAKNAKGEEIGPPEVFDSNDHPYDGLIGNDSVVTVNVIFYDTRKGVGTRLMKVRVEELVPYEERSVGGFPKYDASKAPF